MSVTLTADPTAKKITYSKTADDKQQYVLTFHPHYDGGADALLSLNGQQQDAVSLPAGRSLGLSVDSPGLDWINVVGQDAPNVPFAIDAKIGPGAGGGLSVALLAGIAAKGSLGVTANRDAGTYLSVFAGYQVNGPLTVDDTLSATTQDQGPYGAESTSTVNLAGGIAAPVSYKYKDTSPSPAQVTGATLIVRTYKPCTAAVDVSGNTNGGAEAINVITQGPVAVSGSVSCSQGTQVSVPAGVTVNRF